MRWHASHRFDPAAKLLADRHYNREKPESPQFAPAGSCRVFLTGCGRALWVTSAPAFARHAWVGDWVCTVFRNEGVPGKSSALIREAIAATRSAYGALPPAGGMVTFVDPDRVPGVLERGERVFGYCFKKAGFRFVGLTEVWRLWVWRLEAEDFPPPCPALPRSMRGAPLFDAAPENRP